MPEAEKPDAATGRIEEAAQDWLLRLNSGAATDDDLAALEAWCAADPRHRAAFEEVSELWAGIDGLRAAFAVTTGAGGEPAPPGRRRTTVRHVAIGGLLAASLACIVIAADLPTLISADHRAGVGEQATVHLPDGSVVHLNTDTAVSVDYSADRRHISLLRGEALFEVESRPDRPFAVLAHDGRARALGTVFAVRADDGSTIVTVAEGQVQVASPAGAGDRRRTGVTLGAGEQVSYRTGMAPEAVRRVDPDAATAWRRGELLFRARPLAAALAEIDRYRPGRIVLLGASARLDPVTARISLDALDGGIGALAATHGLTVTRVTNYLLIVH